jgi:hypothetical protein
MKKLKALSLQYLKSYLAIQIVAVASICNAAELYEPYISIRAMGMGNAYTSVVDDKDSLFYNPAGLNRAKGINWTMSNGKFGINGTEVIEVAQKFNGNSTVYEQARGFFGKKIWLSGSGGTILYLPNFAFGIYNSADISAKLTNPAYPNLYINTISDIGVAGGASFELFPQVALGFVGKRISRTGSRAPIGIETLALLSSTELQKQLQNRGTGYSLDAGVNFFLPGPTKPTFSFVWKDLGLTTFTKESGSTAPPMQRDEQILGFGLTIPALVADIRPTVDYKYMNRTDEQLGKKVHVGVEFDFPILAFRAGFNQGYYTLGAGIDLGVLKVDAATWGTELGEYPGQEEDRRYAVQFSLEFGFDPGFGSSGSSKASRFKKQRR